MDLEVAYIRSIDVGGYKYNYVGFYEKFIYKISMNRVRTTTTKNIPHIHNQAL